MDFRGGGLSMSIVLWISANLSRLAKGAEGFEVDGETVGECIDDLVSIVPAMRDTIFLGSRLSPNVQVEVNKQSIDQEKRLTTKVNDGDEIRIMYKGR
jgi:molybdopterin converting factor small subunit